MGWVGSGHKNGSYVSEDDKIVSKVLRHEKHYDAKKSLPEFYNR